MGLGRGEEVEVIWSWLRGSRWGKARPVWMEREGILWWALEREWAWEVGMVVVGCMLRMRQRGRLMRVLKICRDDNGDNMQELEAEDEHVRMEIRTSRRSIVLSRNGACGNAQCELLRRKEKQKNVTRQLWYHCQTFHLHESSQSLCRRPTILSLRRRGVAMERALQPQLPTAESRALRPMKHSCLNMFDATMAESVVGTSSMMPLHPVLSSAQPVSASSWTFGRKARNASSTLHSTIASRATKRMKLRR